MRYLPLIWLCLTACNPLTEGASLYLKIPVNTQTKTSEQFVRIRAGERKQLAASVERTNGTQDKTALSWSSADTHIAAIDDQGILTGVKPGKTYLLLRARERPERQIQITVEVEARPPEADTQEDELSDTAKP